MRGSSANEQRYRVFNPSKLRWIAFTTIDMDHPLYLVITRARYACIHTGVTRLMNTATIRCKRQILPVSTTFTLILAAMYWMRQTGKEKQGEVYITNIMQLFIEKDKCADQRSSHDRFYRDLEPSFKLPL